MVNIDETIKKNVTDELFWDSQLDASNITVEVNDHKVFLKGTVPTYREHSQAFTDAWSVPDVQEVINELDVTFEPEIKIPSDEEIKSSIENILLWDSSIDSNKIEVEATTGIVTLEGEVDAYWKCLRAEDLVVGVNGVVDVINKLAVVPTEDFLDKVIAESVVEAITRRLSVSIDDVDVKVENGVVDLIGTVPDYQAYQGAMNAARYTSGVVDIKDSLMVA